MKLIIQLFWEFFKMGLFTFGGGLAMLPLIQDLAVNKKKWLSEQEAVDCIALCQALPGVIAINSAIYIGNRQKGFIGALSSAVGVILPSFTIIIVAVLFLGAIENNPYVNGAFEGIKAASAGLISVAAYQVGKQVIKSKMSWLIAVASFVIITVFGMNAVFAIIIGGIVGYVSFLLKRIAVKRKEKRGGD